MPWKHRKIVVLRIKFVHIYSVPATGEVPVNAGSFPVLERPRAGGVCVNSVGPPKADTFGEGALPLLPSPRVPPVVVARTDAFSRESKNADFHETVSDFLKS